MVRKGTWVLLVILLALIGFSLYLQKRKDSELAAATATSSMVPLFSGDDELPGAIRIENAAGDAVAFSRGADGKWVLTAPSEAAADQAAAEAAATQVGALRSLSTVRLAPDVIGLDDPDYTLTITIGQAAHILLVGSATPIQDGYYAQLDGGKYQVIDKAGLDALIGLLKTPPYPATPTSAASATPLAPPTAVPGTPTGTGAPDGATPSP